MNSDIPMKHKDLPKKKKKLMLTLKIFMEE